MAKRPASHSPRTVASVPTPGGVAGPVAEPLSSRERAWTPAVVMLLVLAVTIWGGYLLTRVFR